MSQFKIISCGRNAQKWLKPCLDSILNQDYEDYEILYLDDASDYFDPSEYINNPKIKFFRNTTRQGMTVNFKKLVNLCDDDDYIIRVDADDWLIGYSQFKDLNEIYNRGYEMTYGGIKTTIRTIYNQIAPIDIVRTGDIRSLKLGFHFQGLRTSKAKYIKMINDKDLKYNGEWVPVLNDSIIFACVSEMLRERVFQLEGERYVWNTSESVNNNFKTNNNCLYEIIWDHFSRKDPYDRVD